MNENQVLAIIAAIIREGQGGKASPVTMEEAFIEANDYLEASKIAVTRK